MKSKYQLFIICCLLLLSPLSIVAQSYGLSFSSHDVVQDKRTGLDLSSKKGICLENSFELRFDFAFAHSAPAHFGYIFRLIDQNNKNIDLIYDERFHEDTHFKLIIGEEFSNVAFDIGIDELYKKWFTLQFFFNKEKQQLIVTANGKQYIQPFKFKGSCYKLFFGSNNLYKEFKVTDVPPMKIKDIEILDKNQKQLYNWQLNEREGTDVAERIEQADGKVANPIWIREQHHDWNLLRKLDLFGAASVAFNKEKEQLYFIGEDSLYTLDIATNLLNSTPYRSGKQYLLSGNQSLFESGKLMNFYVDQKLVSTFDFSIAAWDKPYIYPADITNYWHPNKFYFPKDSSLYIIGGYGQYKYKKEVNRYSFGKQEWIKENTTGYFTPRYLAALGAANSGAYIIGGYGSSSGEQILNPKNIYDMVFFDPQKKSFRKIFELDSKVEEFAFANSLVINEKENTYYALVFPNHKYNSSLQLIKGRLDSPKYTYLGNKIPYAFYDIHSFADLFYCENQEKFVSVTLYRDDKTNKSQINIYTLSSPVEVTIADDTSDLSFSYQSYYMIIPAVVFLIGIIVYLFWAKNKRLKSKAVQPDYSLGEAILNSHKNTGEIKDLQTGEQYNSDKEDYKNAVFLFGDFQLFDKDGNDITKLFTPLIKELFLIVLLYTLRWGRGISSEKLTEILWFDKTNESARNNRSVNIAKLKTILDKLEGCQISKETGYWKIKLSSGVYVDYKEYLHIVSSKKELTKTELNQLTAIVQKGSFLSNLESEWLDQFKSDISNDIIDTYLRYMAKIQINDDPEFIVSLANYIFYFDPVNEEAMVFKCKALAHLGKHSLAKSAFENFNKEYKHIYGEEFHKSFHEILE